MAERSAKQLGLSKADLPNSIIEVIATLSKAGFDAYIVGGSGRRSFSGGCYSSYAYRNSASASSYVFLSYYFYTCVFCS